jgi:hypothetical protein
MYSRRIILASIVVSALLTAGCLKDAVREVSKGIGELMTVRNELVKKYGEDVFVNVYASGGRKTLSVTFINSVLNDKSQAERSKRAQEAAQVVKTHYTNVKDLDVIWVGFVRQTTRFIVFHTTQGLDYFGFDKNGAPLQPPPYNQPAGVELDATAGYLSESDETDISASGIQLEGQPGGLGITVLPYFRVRGDAREEPAAPPKTVTFNFASYSEKPRFTEPVRIAFISDGTTVFQTKEDLHGKDAQFCDVNVPYTAFRKMVAGSGLIIKLDDKPYSLTPRQLAALQQMDAYVKQ